VLVIFIKSAANIVFFEKRRDNFYDLT